MKIFIISTYILANVAFFIWWFNRKKPVDYSELFCSERALEYRKLALKFTEESSKLKQKARVTKEITEKFDIMAQAVKLDREARAAISAAELWEERTLDE